MQPKQLTDDNLPAADEVARAHGCTLERIRPDAILLKGANPGAVFAALEANGYDVSHVVTG